MLGLGLSCHVNGYARPTGAALNNRALDRRLRRIDQLGTWSSLPHWRATSVQYQRVIGLDESLNPQELRHALITLGSPHVSRLIRRESGRVRWRIEPVWDPRRLLESQGGWRRTEEDPSRGQEAGGAAGA
jgi:hypothetical protein